MKNATIAWILVVVLFTTSVLFAGLYLSARHTLQRTQIALDMTEKSAAELRDNVQAAVVQSDKADKTDAVCGIYYCDNAPNMNKLDLRSDGTAHFYYSNGMEIPSTRQTKQGWTLDGQKVTVGAKTFTIEQTDLIDNRGNRWLHIR